MGSQAFANGGLLLKDIITPKWEDYTLNIKSPGSIVAQDTMELGNVLDTNDSSNNINGVFIKNLCKVNVEGAGPNTAAAYKVYYMKYATAANANELKITIK
jgi:hypothetical protein